MKRKPLIDWLAKPKQEDYAAAQSYLSLVMDADLAAKYLEGKINAARFVAGEEFEIIDSIAPLRRSPSPDAPLETEALKGERVMIYEITEEGFAWGQLESDSYVGWLRVVYAASVIVVLLLTVARIRHALAPQRAMHSGVNKLSTLGR